MSWLWQSLRREWSREDVLARTAVVIQVISMTSSFVFIRAIWLGQARRFLQSQSAPLRSLLTIGTIGEAGDIIALLRNGLLQGAHLLILCQCILVIRFVVMAALAAPFAKLATKSSSITQPQNITGYLGETLYADAGYYYPVQEFGKIRASLDAAHLLGSGYAPSMSLATTVPDHEQQLTPMGAVLKHDGESSDKPSADDADAADLAVRPETVDAGAGLPWNVSPTTA